MLPLRSLGIERMTRYNGFMSDFIPVKLEGVVAEEVGQPRNDGTRGSALYKVPIKLSANPPIEWAELFEEAWRNPSSFTLRHRPSIASVVGNRVILDGTTLEEVEEIHAQTLKNAVAEANRGYEEYLRREREGEAQEGRRREEHQKHIQDLAKRIKFD